MGKKSDNFGFILEHIEDQLKTIFEMLAGLADVPARLTTIENDLFIIKGDLKAIKAIAKIHNQTLDNHETRITKLETA